MSLFKVSFPLFVKREGVKEEGAVAGMMGKPGSRSQVAEEDWSRLHPP